MEYWTKIQQLVPLVHQHWWLAGLLIVGITSYLLYRIIDFAQIQYVKRAAQPQDLPDLKVEVYESKRQRKRRRSISLFWKGAISWLVQAGFILVAMPILIAILYRYGIGSGAIYMVLMIISFLLNMLLSKLFPLWSPTRPFACRAYQGESAWRPSNMAFQAWGIASWAVPVYFFWDYFQINGWLGSVVFIFVAQILQLVVFIYSIKQKAIPFQEYEGLSDNFKNSLHLYLQQQNFRDDEVGVLTGMKMGPNAFATSIGSYRQIVLTEELIKGYVDPQNPDFTFKLGDDTLEAITSHEVGHIKNHHIEKSIVLGATITSLVTIAVYYLFSGPPDRYLLFDAQTGQQLLLYWGQSFFNVALLYPLTFMMLFFARKNEFEADTFLLETNGCKNGQDFFHQIRHIAPVRNLPIWHKCNGTHPQPHVREQRMIKWSDEYCQ